MKKTDIYTSIDGIRQNKCLKEQITKAVEENDKVMVIKRPLFVPIMAGLLLCLNIGMVAKLIIFNKSQVNMYELKARTSMSRISDPENDERQNNIEARIKEKLEEQKRLARQEGKSEEEIRKMENEEKFKVYVDDFKAQISGENYVIAAEWGSNYDEDPENYFPAYMDAWNFSGDYDDDYDDSINKYSFRRYIRTLNINGSRIYTNHEFIICYQGKICDENIYSITESEAVPQNISEEVLTEEIDKLNGEKVQNFKTKLSLAYYDDIKGAKDITPVTGTNHYVLYPSPVNDELMFVTQSAAKATIGDYDDSTDTYYYDGENTYTSLSDIYLVNSDAVDVTADVYGKQNSYQSYQNHKKYWKDTLYLTEGGAKEKAQVPDVVGMDYIEARKMLNELGFGVNVNYCQFEYYDEYETNKTIDLDDFEPNQVVSMDVTPGEYLYKDSKIRLMVRGDALPYVQGLPVEEAKEKLDKRGYTYELDYCQGVDPDDPDLYVFSVNTSNNVAKDKKVKLYLQSFESDTTSLMIGKLISIKRSYCSPN